MKELTPKQFIDLNTAKGERMSKIKAAKLMQLYSEHVIESRMPTQEEINAYSDKYSLAVVRRNDRDPIYSGFRAGCKWLTSKLKGQ